MLSQSTSGAVYWRHACTIFALSQPELSVLVFAACCLNLAAQAQTPAAAGAHTLVIDGLGKGTAPLDGPWQFHLGDDPAWAAPGFDDSHWEQLAADKSWGAQGHPSYTGFAWYRRTIHITPSPGAEPNIALLHSARSTMPTSSTGMASRWGSSARCPRTRFSISSVPPQTYGLGPIRSGVLAVRVWKLALASNDPDNLGGFEANAGHRQSQSHRRNKGNRDFHWLRAGSSISRSRRFMLLVAMLSFLAWLRDRDQWLLFWMSIYALMPTVATLLDGLGLPYSAAVALFLAQFSIAIREAAGWFLLIWLLQLHQHPAAGVLHTARRDHWDCLRHHRRKFVFSVSGLHFDGADADYRCHHDVAFGRCLKGFPCVLVAYAIYKRKRLDSARWMVAIFAFLNATVYWVENASGQGSSLHPLDACRQD